MWTKRHCFPFKYHFILQKFSLWFASIYWKYCNINWCLCAWGNKTKQKTLIFLPFQETLYKHHWLLPRLIDMGPFLERPGNFSGPKANFKIKTYWIAAQFLGQKQATIHCILFKTIKTLMLSANKANISFQTRKITVGLSRNGPMQFSKFPHFSLIKLLFPGKVNTNCKMQ